MIVSQMKYDSKGQKWFRGDRCYVLSESDRGPVLCVRSSGEIITLASWLTLKMYVKSSTRQEFTMLQQALFNIGKTAPLSCDDKDWVKEGVMGKPLEKAGE